MGTAFQLAPERPRKGARAESAVPSSPGQHFHLRRTAVLSGGPSNPSKRALSVQPAIRAAVHAGSSGRGLSQADMDFLLSSRPGGARQSHPSDTPNASSNNRTQTQPATSSSHQGVQITGDDSIAVRSDASASGTFGSASIQLCDWFLTLVQVKRPPRTISAPDLKHWVYVEGFRVAEDGAEPEMWHSSLIASVHDARHVATGSGSVYALVGPQNRAVSERSFPADLCSRFDRGFPEDWRDALVEAIRKQEAEEAQRREAAMCSQPSARRVVSGARPEPDLNDENEYLAQRRSNHPRRAPSKDDNGRPSSEWRRRKSNSNTTQAAGGPSSETPGNGLNASESSSSTSATARTNETSAPSPSSRTSRKRKRAPAMTAPSPVAATRALPLRNAEESHQLGSDVMPRASSLVKRGPGTAPECEQSVEGERVPKRVRIHEPEQNVDLGTSNEPAHAHVHPVSSSMTKREDEIGLSLLLEAPPSVEATSSSSATDEARHIEPEADHTRKPADQLKGASATEPNTPPPEALGSQTGQLGHIAQSTADGAFAGEQTHDHDPSVPAHGDEEHVPFDEYLDMPDDDAPPLSKDGSIGQHPATENRSFSPDPLNSAIADDIIEPRSAAAPAETALDDAAGKGVAPSPPSTPPITDTRSSPRRTDAVIAGREVEYVTGHDGNARSTSNISVSAQEKLDGVPTESEASPSFEAATPPSESSRNEKGRAPTRNATKSPKKRALRREVMGLGHSSLGSIRAVTLALELAQDPDEQSSPSENTSGGAKDEAEVDLAPRTPAKPAARERRPTRARASMAPQKWWEVNSKSSPARLDTLSSTKIAALRSEAKLKRRDSGRAASVAGASSSEISKEASAPASATTPERGDHPHSTFAKPAQGAQTAKRRASKLESTNVRTSSGDTKLTKENGAKKAGNAKRVFRTTDASSPKKARRDTDRSSRIEGKQVEVYKHHEVASSSGNSAALPTAPSRTSVRAKECPRSADNAQSDDELLL